MNPCSQRPRAKPWRGATGSHGISVFESFRDFPVSLADAPSPTAPSNVQRGFQLPRPRRHPRPPGPDKDTPTALEPGDGPVCPPDERGPRVACHVSCHTPL